MTLNLHGVLTALATPFAADGAIDEEKLCQLVDRSIDGGVHGVVACGSTGEFAAMTAEERRRVIEIVVDQTAGRVPVVAQTGATSTVEAISNSRHAQEVGADVLMLVTPYYEPLTLEETVDYLREVASSVEAPVMLYNIPAATGVNLDPDTVAMLADELENVRYIKDSSANMEQALQLIHHHNDRIATFMGWDSLILSALTEGAAGVMAGAANVVPSQIVGVYDAVVAGDLVSAREQWDELYPVIDALISVPFMPAIKATLEVMGMPIGSPRRPTADLDAQSLERLTSLVEKLQLS